MVVPWDGPVGRGARGLDMPYDAFISYSHAADDALAPAIRHGLQMLARPWNRRRALEVFRDDTGLAVSPGLWTSICAALDQSEHFVLLASPGAAESVWVNREIDYWLESHPVDRLLPVVTDGAWIWNSTGDFDWDRSTAVPPALRGIFGEEPRHLDLQWARTDTELNLRNSRFREAIAQLAAPMHAMTPQDLESADVANYKHVVRLRRAVIVALTVLLVLVSIAGLFAVQNARDARRAQASADQSARDAEEQADRALAGRLLVQADALRNRQKTLSLLLTVEASLLTPDQGYTSLVDGLRTAPGLMKILDYPAPVDPRQPNALAASGDVLAAPTRSGDVQQIDLRDGQRIGDVLDDGDLYPKSPSEMVYSRTGALGVRYTCSNRVLCDREASRRTLLYVWDVAATTGRAMPNSDDHEDPVFSTDGRYLAAYTRTGRVTVWDTRTRPPAIAASRQVSGANPTDLTFSPDAKTLALTVGGGSQVYLLRVPDGLSSSRVHNMPAGTHALQVLLGKDRRLLTRDESGRVALWNPETGKLLASLPADAGRMTDLALDDSVLATASSGGVLALWNPLTLDARGTPHQSGSPTDAVDVAFTAEGGLVSVGGDVRLWSVDGWDNTGSILYRGQSAVTSLAISQGSLLASGDHDGAVTLSTLDSSTPRLQRIQTGQGSLTALALNDEGILASSGDAGSVRLWDASTATPIGALPNAPAHAASTLAFSPDGSTLAAGYAVDADDPLSETPIWLWNIDTTDDVAQLQAGLAGDVSTLVYASSGLLASAASDNVTLTDSGKWRNRRRHRSRGRLHCACHQPGRVHIGR